MKNWLIIAVLSIFTQIPLSTMATESCQNVYLPTIPQIGQSSATRNAVKYWVDKMKEIPNYNRTNFYASVLRLSILTSTKSVKPMFIPLSQMNPIHEITYTDAVQKTKKRAAALAPVIDHASISIQDQNALIPSKNPIRAVPYAENKFVIFDGNGRYWAMLEAFGKNSDKNIEVEVYDVNNAIFRWSIKKTLEERGLDPFSSRGTP